MTQFEAFFFRSMEILLSETPERLPKNRQVKYGEIVGCTDFRDLLKRLIAKELHDSKYKPVEGWIVKLNELVNVDRPFPQEKKPLLRSRLQGT